MLYTPGIETIRIPTSTRSWLFLVLSRPHPLALPPLPHSLSSPLCPSSLLARRSIKGCERYYEDSLEIYTNKERETPHCAPSPGLILFLYSSSPFSLLHSSSYPTPSIRTLAMSSPPKDMIDDISIAVVCHSNLNRSMEAHKLLNDHNIFVRSYGAGTRVKLPGETPMTPNVYEFGTEYEYIYNDLVKKNEERYTKTGKDRLVALFFSFSLSFFATL